MDINTELIKGLLRKLTTFITRLPLAVYVGLGIWVGLMMMYYVLFHTLPVRHIWNTFLPGATITIWWLICYPPKTEHKSLYVRPSKNERRKRKEERRINFLWLIVSLIIVILIGSRHS